jgi:hypothetical protein
LDYAREGDVLVTKLETIIPIARMKMRAFRPAFAIPAHPPGGGFSTSWESWGGTNCGRGELGRLLRSPLLVMWVDSRAEREEAAFGPAFLFTV